MASRYSGSDEGRAAQYYLASFQADNGKYSEAEKNFKQVADSRSPYSSLGKVALAQLYAGEGKVGEAKTILDGLIQHPSPLVSKEQAQLLLANLLKDSNPTQAKQWPESLKTPQQRPQIQRAIEPDCTKPEIALIPISMLSHLRLIPEQALGRKYPETPHPYRNDSRGIGSNHSLPSVPPFGRKTQVFAAGLSTISAIV